MITVSLETAKKIRKAGRSRKCQLEWVQKPYEMQTAKLRFACRTFDTSDVKQLFEAPTTQEILDDLPIYLDTKSNEYGSIVLSMEGSATKRVSYYYDLMKGENVKGSLHVADSLADAVALLWLRCKKKKHI